MSALGLLLKGTGSFTVLLAALVLGVLKSPPNPVAFTLLDWFDRFLDEVQGGHEYNLKESKYFQGIFAPTHEELPGGPGLELELLEGAIPEDLAGVFLRIGPNPWAEPTKRHHVFDGDGMLHSVRIKGGKAHYHNAFLRTPRLELEQEMKRAYFPRIGELHGPIGIVKALTTLEKKAELAGIPDLRSGAANTAVGVFPSGRLWALHEGSLPFEFRLSPEGGVASVGYNNFSSSLDYPFSAHPKVDFARQEVIFHGYSFKGGSDGETFLKFGRMNQAGDVEAFFKLDAPGASFSHDMLLSEHYAIVIDSSVRFTPEKTATGGSPFTMKKDYQARLAVIPRNAASLSEVKWFTASESLAWVHPLHAWEEGKELVLWAPLGFPSNRTGGVLEGCCEVWYMSEMRLNLETQSVEVKRIDSSATHHGEFSRIRDDLVAGGPVRYGYTTKANSTSQQDFDFIGFTKWDMQEKRVAAEIHLPKGWIAGENIFVPRSQATGDPSDDGFIVSFMFGVEETHFVLYDARTFSETPVARLRMPRRVPVGFHGSWVTEAALKQHLAL